MVRIQLPLIIRIAVGVSLCFVFLQTLLLIYNCQCVTNEGVVVTQLQKRSLEEQFLEKSQQYESDIRLLEQKVKRLEKELSKHQHVNKFLVGDDGFYSTKMSLDDLTFLNSYKPKNEFEVIPYDSFTSKHLFGEIGYLSKRPSASPIGQQVSEMRQVLNFALKTLNFDIESKADRAKLDLFAEGIKRNDLMHGTVYDLYFRSSHSNKMFKRLKVLRPFMNLKLIGEPETIDSSNEWINLILPLAGRLEAFQAFMERFVETCVRIDKRIFLTVVYFGLDGRDTIKEIMLNISKKESYEHYKVIFSQEEFNRGKGIQQGVESWDKGNVLMFFCDVDVYFTVGYLERCRLYASPKQRIYYPIVFSQYNPEIVFGGNPPPPLKEQMYLNYDSGFWRDFGFGMTCQYRNDYLNVGGFDLSIKGWGGEDVALYKQHLRSDVTIIRAYDRGILHVYHSKNCRKTLSDQQFISCLQSKAVTEGSHKQLGMLAFGNSLISGSDPNWTKRLQASLNEVDKLNEKN